MHVRFIQGVYFLISNDQYYLVENLVNDDDSCVGLGVMTDTY